MGPTEILTVMTAAVAKDAVSALVETVFGDVAKAATGTLKTRFRRWKTPRTALKVYERSKQIRRVKTLWHVEKDVDLYRFYYPSKIKSAGEAPREVHKLQDFGFDGNLVVRGVVGQGKSTFLRYLTAQELVMHARIPVFVELRRLTGAQSVVDGVIEEMMNLGLEEADTAAFEHLAKSGRLALFLDGFDEVTESQVSKFVHELESLAVRMPKLQIIVTSRPDTAIERSPQFRVFDLAPLGAGEFANVVARIARNPTLGNEIVSGVNKSHQSIAKLLTTPLMVWLLVVQYRVGQGIPENRVAFYEPLFGLLLQRHDGAKAGYRRARASGLSDAQLLSFFNCLCFITRRDGVSVLRQSALDGAAARAIKWVNLGGCPPEAAVDDVVRITCLLLKDGVDEYRYLHKSVQEFHAACFVREQQDTLAGEFYGAMQRRWLDWEQELQFLKAIHQERYDRYFAVPMLDQVVSTLVGASPCELGQALIGRLTARVMLRPKPEFQNLIYPRDPVGWCLMNYFDGSGLFEGIAETSARLAGGRAPAKGSEYQDVPLHDVLPALNERHLGALTAAAEDLGQRITGALNQARARVHTLEERKGLFDI